MIESLYNTPFTTERKTELKVDGRLQTVALPLIIEGMCAVFTPRTERTVSSGQKKFIIEKTIYCGILDITTDDLITINGIQYTAILVEDTNNEEHHLKISAVKL